MYLVKDFVIVMRNNNLFSFLRIDLSEDEEFQESGESADQDSLPSLEPSSFDRWYLMCDSFLISWKFLATIMLSLYMSL